MGRRENQNWNAFRCPKRVPRERTLTFASWSSALPDDRSSSTLAAPRARRSSRRVPHRRPCCVAIGEPCEPNRHCDVGGLACSSTSWSEKPWGALCSRTVLLCQGLRPKQNASANRPTETGRGRSQDHGRPGGVVTLLNIRSTLITPSIALSSANTVWSCSRRLTVARNVLIARPGPSPMVRQFA